MDPSVAAPGVWRITVPLPYRPRTVHAYLVEADGGSFALVDGGADTDDGWAALDRGVRAVAGRWSLVRLHVVTHMHVDHLGLAGRIREASGAPLAMGRLDAERAAHATEHPEEEARYRERLLTEAGAAPELVARASAVPAAGARGGGAPHCDHPLREPVDAIPGLAGWQVLWSPGHTAGHVSLFRPGDGLLIAGDAVLPGITPTIGVNRQRSDPVSDYLQGLERISAAGPELVLPGHGPPIVEPHARLQELRQETLAESQRVLRLLENGGRTAAEVANERYAGRDLPWAQRVQAIRESIAHLHHLLAGGRAWSERDGQVVRFWQT